MANITLGEGLLAAGSGLFKGLNANRAGKEEQRRYDQQQKQAEAQQAYLRSRQSLQDALDQQKLDIERQHELNLGKSYDALETPAQKAARDASRGTIRKYVADTAASTARLRALTDQNNNIRTNNRISASDKARLLQSNAEELGRETRNLRDQRTQLMTAKSFAQPQDLPDIMSKIAESDSLLSQHGKEMPALFKSAVGALGGGTENPAALPARSEGGIPFTGGDGDGSNVEGATDNAIETPQQYDYPAPDQFSMPGAPSLGQALQPAQPQAQPSLGQAVGGDSTGGIPPDVDARVRNWIVTAKKYRPGSNEFNREYVKQVRDWQMHNATRGQ